MYSKDPAVGEVQRGLSLEAVGSTRLTIHGKLSMGLVNFLALTIW